MNTLKLVDKAYKNAKRIKFNNNSKIILFSDVHRGDNSLSDDFAHNQNIYYYALEYYYNRGFSYELMGKFKMAELDYRKALEILPNYDLAVQGLNEVIAKQ
jgi:tetratricopeptide (TPR) repeat protein